MDSKLTEKSCMDFTELLSSSAPVPGGTGTAALADAIMDKLVE